MPLYDFECPHKHRFERQCKIAERTKPVPCEGMVNRVVEDGEGFDEESLATHRADMSLPLPKGMSWADLGDDKYILVKEVNCMLMAKHVEISFADHNLILDHGSASNRDAAREGRYDPLNPNRRFMAKGRSWRK